ncbi:MAG: hypothetical protein Q8N44_20100 [Rubrivivax sp.]|nr:hypothetical protein [Rubrivivax sp.]
MNAPLTIRKHNLNIGFTGSRKGMTDAQKAKVKELMSLLHPNESHHGDATGSDMEFHQIARSLHGSKIVTHPSDATQYRAYCPANETRAPLPPLTRNKNIVNAVDMLIATPDGTKEKPRSGTWSTIRAAKNIGLEVVVVSPMGQLIE